MSLPPILFYLFGAMALTSAVSVVFAKHPVRAVLSLVLTFVATAGTWLILQAEFLAIVLVLVYVGAVMVLFLFVVMMLDVEIEQLKGALVRHFPIAFGLTACLAFFLISGFLQANSQTITLNWVGPQDRNVEQLGYALFTDYILPFEVAGVLLLVAIVAAIALTFRGKQGMNRAPNPAEQVTATPKSRLKIISMKAERP